MFFSDFNSSQTSCSALRNFSFRTPEVFLEMAKGQPYRAPPHRSWSQCYPHCGRGAFSFPGAMALTGGHSYYPALSWGKDLRPCPNMLCLMAERPRIKIKCGWRLSLKLFAIRIFSLVSLLDQKAGEKSVPPEGADLPAELEQKDALSSAAFCSAG